MKTWCQCYASILGVLMIASSADAAHDFPILGGKLVVYGEPQAKKTSEGIRVWWDYSWYYRVAGEKLAKGRGCVFDLTLGANGGSFEKKHEQNGLRFHVKGKATGERVAAEASLEFRYAGDLGRIGSFAVESEVTEHKINWPWVLGYTKNAWLNSQVKNAEDMNGHINWAQHEETSRVKDEVARFARDIEGRIGEIPDHDRINTHGWLKEAVNQIQGRNHSPNHIPVTREWLKKHRKDQEFVKGEMKYYIQVIENAARE